MKRSPTPMQQAPSDWSYRTLADHHFWTARGLLAAWYRLTAPPDPPAGASFEQRYLVRKGRIASGIMLFLGMLLLMLVLPIGLLGTNHTIAGVALQGLVWIGISSLLNRKGYVTLAGILMYCSVNLGMVASILHVTLVPFRVGGALTPDDTDIFYLLVYGDVFLGAILSPDWVILPVVANITFGLIEVFVGPHTPELTTLLAHPGSLFILAFRIIQMHVLVPGVVWILGKNIQEIVQRADSAEEIARFTHDVAQMKEQEAQQAVALEQVIETVIGVFQQVAQGNLEARMSHAMEVPFIGTQTFWSLAGSINTHLKRYQRARQAEQDLEVLRPRLGRGAELEYLFQRIETQQALFAEALAKAQVSHQPLQLPMTGTPLDTLYRQLNGKYVTDSLLPNLSISTQAHQPVERRA